MSVEYDDAPGVGARGVEEASGTAAPRDEHITDNSSAGLHKPALPSGFLRAREALRSGPPMTDDDIAAFEQQVQRIRIQDDQRRRDRGYPFG